MCFSDVYGIFQNYIYVDTGASCFGFRTLFEKLDLIPRRRWEGNVKMDFQELGLGGMTGLI
jgi:hypothetical protein